jgi:hypothetical protein
MFWVNFTTIMNWYTGWKAVDMARKNGSKPVKTGKG